MTAEDDARIAAYAHVEFAGGLTVRDLRLLLEAVDRIGIPDSTRLYARTKWKFTKHGNMLRRLVATQE